VNVQVQVIDQVIDQVMQSLCRVAGANVVQSMLCMEVVGEGEGAEVKVVQRWCRGAPRQRYQSTKVQRCLKVQT
jgi:hypothetical protein